MMEGVKVMLVVGLMVTVIQADVKARKETNENGFGLLCDVMRLVRGLWNTATSDYEDFTAEDVRKLGQTINKIFFGEKGHESETSSLFLPDRFTEENPVRSDVCGYNRNNKVMQSAAQSMASAIFCLCTGITGVEDFCGLTNVGKGKWSNQDPEEDVKGVFKVVWGEKNDGGVMQKCDNTGSSENLEQERENLTAYIEKIEETLEKIGGVFAEKHTTCEGKTPCANVTRKPIWLENLKETEKITLAIIQSIKENSKSKQQTTESESAEITVPEPKSAPTHPATTLPATTQVLVKSPKQETRKALEEKTRPKPEPETEKPIEAPQKQKEDHLPVPENETSVSFLNSQKWLLATLLI
ncbi:Variant surface glycoprotein [Trypanosoma congolense IL3000]|uniref:Variant surface glycoprotein n=1 Tax=Trypanosoma congolense (strain IL3000) TaxID=1068625 RepID=F9W7Z2_TRYCI|nr:Variant surface glycoprotein [Trypanosoma congolense IL3000]